MTLAKFDTGALQKEQAIFTTNNIDRHAWNKVIDSVDPAHNNPVETYPIERDAFLSLLQSNPSLKNSDLSDTQQHVGQLFNRAMKVPQYQNLRQQTVNNPVMAGVACTSMVDGVMYGLSDDVKQDMAKQAQKQEEATKKLEQAVQFSEMAQDFAESGETELSEEWQEESDKLKASGERAQRAADNLQESIENQIGESGVELDYAIAKAAEKTSDQLDQISAVFKGFSEATDTNPKQFSPEIVKGLMQIIRNHPNLEYFVACLGWAFKKIGEIERQLAEGRVDIYEIESGELDMESMIATEVMALAEAVPQALVDDFYGRVVDNSVMQYVYKGTSPLGHGPLILISDQSGSMEWNDNHSMVVALKWAIFSLCGRQNRRCVDIAFSGMKRFWEYDNEKHTPEDYITHLTRFDAGGTEPYRPMMRGMEIVREIAQTDDKQGGDMVMFTDDSFGNPLPAFESDLKHTKTVTDDSFKLVSVILGQFGNGHMCEQFSDQTLFLSDLLAEKNREKLGKMIGEIV